MRIFLGIDIPPQIKRQLSKKLIPLMREYPHFKWVPEDNFHLTLHFFGEMAKIDFLINQIDKAIYDIPSFNLYSRSLDVYLHHSLIIHLNFFRQKTLEAAVEKIRSIPFLTQQKHFFNYYDPHLTIARGKPSSKQQYFLLKKKLGQQDINLEITVYRFTLYRSILRAQAPLYQVIKTFPLYYKYHS